MPAEFVFPDLPQRVREVIRTLGDAGHEVAIVGGAVRDRLLGLAHRGEWDAATAARPEEVVSLFPGATWENRFGTVTIGSEPAVEVTSYRAEGTYRDRRRPDEVRFGVSLTEDLARRDFTINAMAWLPLDLEAGRGALVDPVGGQPDLDARVLRAVGEPRERFAEDALRLIRAARFAGRLELTIEPATERAIRQAAPTVEAVSAERVRDELMRILALDATPSGAIGILERLGLLVVILPELTALRGVPQSKAIPGDALDHSLAAVDAAAATEPHAVRLAALLHDLGKATTMRDGHFIGHETVSAELAANVLHRLRVPRALTDRVVGAISHHMYDYESAWTDAAVRRLVHRLDGVDRDLCSPCAAPTMRPPGSGRPATPTRPSSRRGSPNSWRRSPRCSSIVGWRSTAMTSSASWACRRGRRSVPSSIGSPRSSWTIRPRTGATSCSTSPPAVTACTADPP